ncbi:hypothetical protein OS493_009032 [Desmophyllum pertusum]|uniref:Uncharacterized protein n=1 Tax=Desmophyllum pertusum TaxID=174260 RepID=A0A9X0CYT8_9CNID|nr:hypothetical protein OS493_009032 [Desmophyllum pertusum]
MEGNHAVAIVKEKENYDALKESLANVIRDVNALIEVGHMIVDGQRVNLDFYLGGDYKFLLIAMGMKAATSNNSCVWCKIFKNERVNLSHSCEYFQTAEMIRKIDEAWSTQPGCHSQPFFNIPLENVILDELHLMLRITDRLEEGIILEILKWDKDDNQTRSSRQKTDVHLQEFLTAVRSLGNFSELLDILNSENLTDADIRAFQAKALTWGKQVIGMSGSGPGYIQKNIITPYMHSLIYHVPVMLQRYGSLRSFSGQGVEKKNDDLRRYFHRKINRWDAATNLLLVEKRQDALREMERVKRTYDKRKASFWVNGGKQEAAKKVPRISTALPDPIQTTSIMTESVESLKNKTVSDLLDLLQQRTGQRLNKRTRKQNIIDALLLVRSE